MSQQRDNGLSGTKLFSAKLVCQSHANLSIVHLGSINHLPEKPGTLPFPAGQSSGTHPRLSSRAAFLIDTAHNPSPQQPDTPKGAALRLTK